LRIAYCRFIRPLSSRRVIVDLSGIADQGLATIRQCPINPQSPIDNGQAAIGSPQPPIRNQPEATKLA
jgi:hypothetical protein